jgi:hypothetical protein
MVKRQSPKRTGSSLYSISAESRPGTLTGLSSTPGYSAIEEIFIKYYAINVDPSLMGLEPALMSNWMAPFEIPWLVTEKQ